MIWQILKHVCMECWVYKQNITTVTNRAYVFPKTGDFQGPRFLKAHSKVWDNFSKLKAL